MGVPAKMLLCASWEAQSGEPYSGAIHSIAHEMEATPSMRSLMESMQ